MAKAGSGSRYTIQLESDEKLPLPGTVKVYPITEYTGEFSGKLKITIDHPPSNFCKITLTTNVRGGKWENIKVTYPGHVVVKEPTRFPIEICPSGACNIIVYVVDALRADRLGCYGYKKPTSPHIDEFAKESIIYQRAHAPATWTRPSIASLFTGQDSPIPGGVGREDILRSDIPTLAETLKKAGYHTAGYVSNGNIAPELGFGRGFDEYIYFPEKPELAEIYPSSRELLDQALPKLEKVQEPFFAYIHTIDPHAPYTPPKEYAQRFIPPGATPTPGTMDTFKKFIWRNPEATDSQVAYLSGLYDGEVAAADDGFGYFLDWLKKRLYEHRTVVIFTSDHGEEFYDHHGLGHGGTLYEELLHVPLIIHFPAQSDIKGPSPFHVSLSDLMPSILDHLGIRRLSVLDRNNILFAYGTPRPIYSYERLDKVEKESVIIQPFKLIHNINKTNQWGETVLEYELYNLETDPGEHNSLLNEKPITFQVLLHTLNELHQKNFSQTGHAAPSAIPPDLKKRLQALGY